MNRINYRKLAFEQYKDRLFCAHCGFGIPEVLEVAHLDGHRHNNEISNLVLLCPTCHKMFDLDLISTDTIIQMRDRPRVVSWAKRMKDAGKKAALSRKHRETAQEALGSFEGSSDTSTQQSSRISKRLCITKQNLAGTM